MLKTFFSIDGFTFLPGSNGLYKIDSQGLLLDALNNAIPSVLDPEGNHCYDIFWLNGRQLYKTAFLLLIVFKPVHIHFSKLQNINVGFIDGNKQNLSLNNVVWKFPVTGIETETGSGFYHIPGYTSFSIDKNGNIRNNFNNNILEGSLHESGYRYYSVKEDVPTGTRKGKLVGRHRLLAFTFLDYPLHADSLDVNHKNGIPGDDRVENLEWATRQENILHAYANGLRGDNKSVIVHDLRTGEETEYFSTHDCEKKLGIGRSMVHYRIKHGNGKYYPPGLSFRYKDATVGVKAKQYSLKCTCLATGEVTHYPSIVKCALEFKVSKKCINRRLRDNDSIVFKGFSIEKIIN